MKTTFFSILIFLLCLANVGYAQSPTLTGFNGKIEFKSFVTNGDNIRGTLINFIDQTNQYTAANIAVNDIAWDNQGRRYKVVAIVPTPTSTQAVVDLSRVGGGTHFPRGLGFISREDNLALIPPSNTLGISAKLSSQASIHNTMIINNLLGNVGSILFVSTIGNDDIAVKGRIDLPFRTLTSAVNSAIAGDLIYVRSGTYNVTGNLWKSGVNWHFENVTAGSQFIALEYGSNQALFKATNSGFIRITGNLVTSQLIQIDTANVTVRASGYELGQVIIGAGAINADVIIRTTNTKSAIYSSSNANEELRDNKIFYYADQQTPVFDLSHAPLVIFNNSSGPRPKRLNYHIEIGMINFTAPSNQHSIDRGTINARSTGTTFDSSSVVLKIGKGRFTSTLDWGLIAFMPYNTGFANSIEIHCDDCEFRERASMSSSGFMPRSTDFLKISGRYKTYSNKVPLLTGRSDGGSTTNQRCIFDGEFIATDTCLFVLPVSHNYEFRGLLQTMESDDPVIIANWANGSFRPLLKSVLITTPCTIPIRSNVATTWYTAGCYETKTITKSSNITYIEENKY